MTREQCIVGLGVKCPCGNDRVQLYLVLFVNSVVNDRNISKFLFPSTRMPTPDERDWMFGFGR